MAVTENGRAAPSGKDQPNGHVGGNVLASRKRLRPRKTWSSWLLNNIARLAVWYTLITVTFRCPSNPTKLEATSPQVCKPYLATKAYVQPYLQPYYDTYASKYVEAARPYYDQANRLAIKPASKVLITNYEKYAVPQIEKASAYGQTQWEQYVRPQLGIAQERASSLYSANIEHHVAQASSIATPYYENARENVVQIHKKHVVPAIVQSRPHLEKAYILADGFIRGTAAQHIRFAWSKTAVFLEGTFWPLLKNIYRDNVKPQLVMISERITKYQEGRKLQSVIDDVEDTLSSSSANIESTGSETEQTTPIAIAETLSSFIASIVDDASSVAGDVSSSVLPQGSRKVEYATDESISEDLIKWQKKFAVAADKGTDDLRERIKDLVDGLVRSDVDGEGKGLADALEKTTELELVNIKSRIRSVVAALPEEPSASDASQAETEIMQAVRDSGSQIRDRAQKVRSWAQRFEADIGQRTSLAADTTLQVLDSIRDLGLQEIGMRWAWMEGVTYSHWQKYHDLRQRFDEWRNEVLAAAVAHPSAIAARELAEVILEESMATTESTAKELMRLKDVAKWKVRARDATDNFEDRILPAAAVSAASKIAEDIQDFTSSVVGTSQGTLESLRSKATDAASDLGSAASSIVAKNAHDADSVLSSASEAAEQAAASWSSAIIGNEKPIAQSLVDEAASSFSSVSSAIIGSSTGTIESVLSEVSSGASSILAGDGPASVQSVLSDAASSASSIVVGSSTGPVEAASSSVVSAAKEAVDSASSIASAVSDSASSIASSVTATDDALSSASAVAEDVYEAVSESASSVASAASSKVFAGAMAQEVKGQIPILDDVFDDDFAAEFSEKVQSIASEAGEQYTDVTKAISEAFFGTSQGQAAQVTSLAREQYLSALSAASSVLYGTPTPAAQRVASEAADVYKQAVAAASSALFATSPTPVAESILQQASSIYSDAVHRADEYRSAAEEVVSKQMAGSQKPIHAQMIESISSAYAGSVSKASARLESAIGAASGQYSSLSSAVSAAIPTQGRIESVSSVAASRLQEALAAASSQYAEVKVAVGATPAPLSVQAQQNYYAAVGYAHDQYSSFIAAGSSVVYGTPTPVYQDLIAQATSRYSQASAVASSSLDAYLSSVSSAVSKATKPKGSAESLVDEASSAYSSLVSVASASLILASEQASLAVYGTKAPKYQKAMETISSDYHQVTAIAAQYMQHLIKEAQAKRGKPSDLEEARSGISAQYSEALAGAKSSYTSASASLVSAYDRALKGSLESFSSAASANWEALVSDASQKIYGSPTPVWASLTSQASEITAQATDVAAKKFVVIQNFVSELIIGKEPDFTESVMIRLSSAYYTGIAASASSLASEAYASGSSIASSVSSVAAAFFTPPPEINSILERVNSQLNDAVEAASVQILGSTPGTIEKATSAAAEAYSSVSSAASEAVYGSAPGYGEAASSSFAAAAQDASIALSQAIWGTPTGRVESASSAVADQYETISSALASSLSVASEAAASVADVAKSKVSEAIYGSEQSAFDSAQAKVLEAVESARSRISELGVQASKGAGAAASVASESIESIASVVSETVSSATDRVKDEL